MAVAIVTAALLLWALAIAVIDWRLRKVPNLLLLLLLLPAIGVLAWRGQGMLGTSWFSSGIGFAVALAVTLPGYAVSRFGAGDVKLAAVLGFVQGWPAVSFTLIAAALVLASMSLAALLVLGSARIRNLRIPAAVALAGGFAVVLLAQAFGVRGA